jgi:VWFA-related protein
MTVAAALSLPAGGGRWLSAQQQPTFRSGVDVVAIDVNVVDTSGRPVDGLKPEDFVVTVDRKPRAILSATYINYGVRISRAAARSGGASVLDTLTGSTRAERVGRNVLVVVDEDSMEPGLGQGIVRGARAFVDNLASTDRVAVATIPRLQSELAFTSDRLAAHRALGNIVTQAIEDTAGEFTIGLQEAYDIELRDSDVTKKVVDRECHCNYEPSTTSDRPAGSPPRPGNGVAGAGTAATPCDPTCPPLVISEANQFALRAHQRAQRSLDALRDLARALAHIPGPKTLVFISGGLGRPETTTSYDPLEPALATGQVSLYTLHVERSQFGQVRTRLSPTPVEDDRLALYGLENLTSAVGGTFVPVIGTYDAAFDRVTTEMSGSYLLSVEVTPTDRDGKPHAVSVRVNHPNVEIRARRQYVISPESPTGRRAENTPSPPPPRRPARVNDPAVSNRGGLAAVSPQLVAMLSRASEWVGNIESQAPRVICDEQYEQTLSQWKSGAVVERGISRSTEDWFVDRRSRLQAEYALVRVAEGTGWRGYRDVLGADGAKVHDRDGRLARVLASPSASTAKEAQQIAAASAAYSLGFKERSVNVPTLAFAFLELANRSRFYFHQETELPVGGHPAAQIGFEERGSPTIFIGRDNRDLPVEGTLWVAPDSGILLRSTVRLRLEVNLDQTDVEITVLYAPSAELDGAWVPSEMRETYTSASTKLECVARYSNYRRLKSEG